MSTILHFSGGELTIFLYKISDSSSSFHCHYLLFHIGHQQVLYVPNMKLLII